MKAPIPGSVELLDRVKEALTPKRLPLLIAIDGTDGCGKSSLASWLAWQLGMPAVQLDLYLTSLDPIQWRTADLGKALLARRIDRGRPVILDGILVLDAIEQIGRKADFLVFVSGGANRSSYASQILAYWSRRDLPATANFTINGFVE